MAYLDEIQEHFRINDPYAAPADVPFFEEINAPQPRGDLPIPEYQQLVARGIQRAFDQGFAGGPASDVGFYSGLSPLQQQQAQFFQGPAGSDTVSFLEGVVQSDIARKAGEINAGIRAETAEGLKELKAREAAARGGGGGALAQINAKLAEAREELATANESYANFMDTVSPGFSEAVDKAKKAAKATAAIERTFDKGQTKVDAEYASASGRVRAIADKVAGEGNEEVANALLETVYEMKGFIDDNISMNRNQTLVMHRAAAGIAAAAAQSEKASVRGQAAREQFQIQAKYEKIINNLLRQRAAAGSARSAALSKLKDARKEFLLGQTEKARSMLAQIEPDTRVLSANADPQQFMQTGLTLFFTELGEDPDLAVPRGPTQNLVAQAAGLMNQFGFKDFATLTSTLNPVTGQPFLTEEESVALMPYEDQLEIAALTARDLETYYMDEMYGQPTTIAGQFWQKADYLQSLGWHPAQARDTVTELFAEEGLFDFNFPFTLQGD